MKRLNLISLALTIVGGLNWGLIGFLDFDVVAALLGAGSLGAKAVYGLVGLAALYQIVPFSRAMRIDEPRAEAARDGTVLRP